MTPEQERKLNDIYEFMQDLKSFDSIPYAVDLAFRERLSDILGLETSTKVATTENQAVNEAGASTYNVLKAPDGFLETNINGTTYYIPYYD